MDGGLEGHAGHEVLGLPNNRFTPEQLSDMIQTYLTREGSSVLGSLRDPATEVQLLVVLSGIRSVRQADGTVAEMPTSASIPAVMVSMGYFETLKRALTLAETEIHSVGSDVFVDGGIERIDMYWTAVERPEEEQQDGPGFDDGPDQQQQAPGNNALQAAVQSASEVLRQALAQNAPRAVVQHITQNMAIEIALGQILARPLNNLTEALTEIQRRNAIFNDNRLRARYGAPAQETPLQAARRQASENMAAVTAAQQRQIVLDQRIRDLEAQLGGCNSKERVLRHALPDTGLVVVLRSKRSNNNNCGIAVLNHFRNKFLGKGHTRPFKMIRRELFGSHMGMLSCVQLGVVASYFGVGVTVVDEAMLVLFSKLCDGYNCEVMLKDQHFYLIEGRVGEEADPPTCGQCGIILRGNHRCGMDSTALDTALRIQVKAKLGVEIDRRKTALLDRRNEEPADSLMQECMDELITRGGNLLLHGPGGVGKSYLCNQLSCGLESMGVQAERTATTGCAALNVELAQTIHSLCGVGHNIELGDLQAAVDKASERVLSNRDLATRIRAMEVLFLDEVFMASARLFDVVSGVLSQVRGRSEVFGGVHIVLSGDVMQLAPVEGNFLFESKVWPTFSSTLTVKEMSTPWRFSGGDGWFDLLSRFRLGRPSREDIHTLRGRMVDEEGVKRLLIDDPQLVVLCTHKADAYEANEARMAVLPGDVVEFDSVDEGRCESLENGLLSKLRVKVGCRVMCTSNKLKDMGLARGSRGEVLEIRDAGCIAVQFDALESVSLIHRIVLEGETGNHRTQFPLELSFAITIHKAQGQTLSKAILQLSNVFDPSQAYVALSRVTSLAGLHLCGFDPWKCTVYDCAREFALNPNSFLGNSPERKCREDRRSISKIMGGDMISGRLYGPNEMVKRKSMFFDFETCHSSKQLGMQPYYCAMQRFVNGELVEKVSWQQGVDGCTDVCNAFFEHIMRIVDADVRAYVEEKVRSKGVTNSTGQFLKESYFLCAYNGGRFDFHWLLQFLLQGVWADRYESSQIFAGPNLKAFSLEHVESGKCALRLHDMCNITNSSLSASTRDFCGKSSKGVFPHALLNREGHQAALPQAASRLLSVELDFFPGQTSEVEKAIDSGELVLEGFHVYSELVKYGHNDVDILVDLYSAVDEVCQEVLKCSVMRFATSNSMAEYGLLSNLPPAAYVRKTRHHITSRMSRYGRDISDFCRTSIVGGKVYPRISQFESTDNGDKDWLAYLDMSGMYVAAMRNEAYPIGPARWADEEELAEIMSKLLSGAPLPWCIAEVDCELDATDLEPAVGYRDEEGKLHWDSCRRVQSYTNIALDLMRRTGGRFHSMRRAVVWDSSTHLFKKWMNVTLNGKESAEREGRTGLRNFYKLLGNSSYGSTLKKDHNNVVKYVHTYSDLKSFHSKFLWTGAFQAGNMLVMLGEDKVMEEDFLSGRSVHLGSFVLDYTKQYLDAFTAAANPFRRGGDPCGVQLQPYYGDTDSLLIHCSQLHAVRQFIRNENGYFVDDLNKKWEEEGFSRVIRLVAPQPKSYAVRYIVGKGTVGEVVKECIKFKGVPQAGIEFEWNGEVCNTLTMTMIEQLVERHEQLKVFCPHKLKKVGHRLSSEQRASGVGFYTIDGAVLSRTLFKTQWSGRDTVFSSFTVPKGYTGDGVCPLLTRADRLACYKADTETIRACEELPYARWPCVETVAASARERAGDHRQRKRLRLTCTS
jgi:ATP-dependent DNA helicase PIF1